MSIFKVNFKHPRGFRILVFCLILCIVAACAVGSDDDDDGSGNSTSQATFSLTATTNDRGIAVVSFGLAENSSKFSVSAQIADSSGVIRLIQLINERGVDYLFPDGSSVSLSNSFTRFIKTASVPSRNLDPGIQNNDTFVVSIQAEDAFGADLVGEDVTFTINSKADPGLEGGNLRINIFLVGDVGRNSETINNVRQAGNIVREIFAGSGVSVTINEVTIDGPVVLPSPLDGDSFYRAASNSVPSPTVNVFVGGDIGGVGVGGTILGFAADIPGPPIASERSAVAISYFNGAGANGIYDGQEIRLLGETIAHESSHFMGLFHPIDFSGGSTVVGSDPLPDTPTCSFITECLSNADLTKNLMFPSPVADGSGGFVNQNFLSPQQRSVVNRYIAVD